VRPCFAQFVFPRESEDRNLLVGTIVPIPSPKEPPKVTKKNVFPSSSLALNTVGPETWQLKFH
jgi:hypothetical protein